MMATMKKNGEMKAVVVDIENLNILTEAFNSVFNYDDFYIFYKGEQEGKYEVWNKKGEKIVESYIIEVIENKIISVSNENRKYKLYNGEGEILEGKEFDRVNTLNQYNRPNTKTVGGYYLYRKILSKMK